MARATEEDIAICVARIANGRSNGICSFRRARDEIPDMIKLSKDDTAPSQTRAGEQMWYQLVRNIRSHHSADGNFIERGLLEHVPGVGYRITDAGKAYLKKKGLS
ncbi:MAG: hypothetical protein M3Q08_06125 [Pseudomonadota bacterium]|nr:hypothetical protein [Pseudomonadota bacterium]